MHRRQPLIPAFLMRDAQEAPPLIVIVSSPLASIHGSRQSALLGLPGSSPLPRPRLCSFGEKAEAEVEAEAEAEWRKWR